MIFCIKVSPRRARNQKMALESGVVGARFVIHETGFFMSGSKQGQAT